MFEPARVDVSQCVCVRAYRFRLLRSMPIFPRRVHALRLGAPSVTARYTLQRGADVCAFVLRTMWQDPHDAYTRTHATGYFRIRRGTDEANVESCVVAADPVL